MKDYNNNIIKTLKRERRNKIINSFFEGLVWGFGMLTGLMIVRVFLIFLFSF